MKSIKIHIVSDASCLFWSQNTLFKILFKKTELALNMANISSCLKIPAV